MLYAVLAIVEESGILQEIAFSVAKSFVVQAYGIFGNVAQAYTTYCGNLGAEISLEHFLAHTYGFEYLGAAIRTNSGNTHFRHNLFQTLVYSLYVVGFGSGIFLLYLVITHQAVEHGKCHIRADSRRTVAQQQCGVHHFAYFARFHYQGCLNALLHRYQIVVHRTDGEQRRYGGMAGIDVAVAEDDVVHAAIHAFLGTVAEFVDGVAKPAFALADVEHHGQFLSFKTFISYVAEYVELGIGEHRLRQAHHLAVAFVGGEDIGSHSADILGERHHQVLANRVDGGVGNLRKLLSEVVEKYLRTVGNHSKRGVVTHGSHRLLSECTHRYDGAVDVLLSESEHAQTHFVVVNRIVHLAAALEFLELYAVGR